MDKSRNIQRALIGQGVNRDDRPFTEWRSRPVRFTPDGEVSTFRMDGTAEFVIVDTQENDEGAIVYLPPLSTTDDGVRFVILNLDKSAQGAPVQGVSVRPHPGDKINEVADRVVEIADPSDCRMFQAFRYEWDADTEGPTYRSWYVCLPLVLG